MLHTPLLQRQGLRLPKPVVTRFAPSPTGYLHIGSARTALFSWAYARNMQGKFLLRIEDTDRERSTEGAVQAIYDGLSWLGLKWDGEPTLQFSRAKRHAEIANELLARGQAYYCYCSQEELAEMRETARSKGLPPRYNGMWRDRDPSEAPAGVAPVIRIKAPLKGEIVVHDHVQGEVVFKTENLDDFIILRSDGTPTYMLAVVVDDHDMGVTHIIRGDDHLTNAARQIIVYNKCDQVSELPAGAISGLLVSALTGDGVPALLETIGQCLVPEPPPPGAAVPFMAAHFTALEEAQAWLASGNLARARRVIEALFAGSDSHEARSATR